jgi:regulator of sigma E protease
MFIIAISILIAVHEFGHFWVAKRLGVKVLRYSIGFGKPIWSKRAGKDQTEYVIASLPLGGYVKMLDEREGEVAEADLPRAFNRQALWKRFAIVLAGPMFNFIFAIVAYWLVLVLGVTGLKPIIGNVAPDSPAAVAGLKPHAQIVSVEGERTHTWSAAFQSMLPVIVDQGMLHLTTRDKAGHESNYVLDLAGLDIDKTAQDPFKALGIEQFDPIPAKINKVKDDYPAQKAGLQAGDTIVQIDDQAINGWTDLARYISKRPDQTLQFTVDRDGQRRQLQITTTTLETNGKKRGVIGIEPVPFDKQYLGEQAYSLLPATGQAFVKTWESSVLMIKLLGKIVTGDVSVKNLSGPINIAVIAGESASLGLERFIGFLALVSISLGILNLLPIPVLDGGHLMFFVVEAVKGRPVSEETEMVGQRIGIALLLMLMAVAFYNDITRFIK